MFFFVFLSLAFSQTMFQIDKFYSQDLTCGNQETSWLIQQVTSCTATTSCQNLNGNAGHQVACSTSFPTLPAGWASLQSYQTSTTCATTPTTFAAPADTCSGHWTGATVTLFCTPVQGSIQDCQSSSATCGGCPLQPATKGGTCVQGNPTLSFTMSSYRFNCPTSTTTRATTTTQPASNSTTTGTTTRPAHGTLLVVGIWSIALIISSALV